MGNLETQLFHIWSLQRFVQGVLQVVKTEMVSTVSNPKF